MTSITSTTTTTTTTTTSSVTPVTGAAKGVVPCIYECLSNLANTIFNWWNPASNEQALDIRSLENRCQFPLDGLPSDVIQLVFVQCLFNEDIKGFSALSRTNTHSFITMRKLMNEAPLTQLCPNLRILDAKTFTFHADLRDIDRQKAMRSYYKLEPFVEGREGLTIIFNQSGLTLKDMKENKCGVTVRILWDKISEELDNVPEEDTGPEMISNAPITETRNKTYAAQETRVRYEVGFDGNPTLIQSLALMIATQEKLKICLFGAEPLTYGRTSTQVKGVPLAFGGSDPGYFQVCYGNRDDEYDGAGGRLNLQVMGPGTPG